MCAHCSLQRQSQIIGIGKDTFGPVVDFVFGEAIGTFPLAGFDPDLVARTEWAFTMG